MEGCIRFINDLNLRAKDIENIKEKARTCFDTYGVYPDSIKEVEGSIIFIARYKGIKVLVAYGEGSFYNELSGDDTTIRGKRAKICSLSVYNNKIVRKAIPFTNPVSHKGRSVTIGLGDRLGVASAGHIRAIKGYNVFPVLAQQSIRELNLTGRTYEEVLAAASWAVLQEGYTLGFGADGDHLKTHEEVRMAIECGFTMITLDCSEHIDNSIYNKEEPEIDRLYMVIPQDVRKCLENKYLGKEFETGDGCIITFTESDLKKTVLIYYKAVNFIIRIYDEVIKKSEKHIDFEISIDETLTRTAAESHYFVAAELIENGVEIASLAPRFCGEFQKGIDYKGDKTQFEAELKLHTSIAGKFGYRVSIHSGSDKFDIFPIVGEKTFGRYHLKTAGTNWLEAVRVIALNKPSLYRRMHRFALAKFEDAKKYYHVSSDISAIPDINTLKDEQLSSLMDIDQCRQVLHITYGFILMAKRDNGTLLFKDEILDFLHAHENEYYNALIKHIGKHLVLLGLNN